MFSEFLIELWRRKWLEQAELYIRFNNKLKELEDKKERR